jgi:hypothetical protein
MEAMRAHKKRTDNFRQGSTIGEQMPDNLIERAREFCREMGWNESSSYLMAAFVRSLEQWTPLRSEDDLPPDGKQYIWAYRNLPGSVTAIYKPRQDTLDSWWVNEFSAYREIEPYQPQGEVTCP